MPDIHYVTTDTRDRIREGIRGRMDGGDPAPRDRGPRRDADTARTVRTSATNDGTQWTAAKLVRTGDPKPGSGAATGDDVQVQPLYGAGVTAGSVTWPAHTLLSGLDYPIAHDSGTTDGGTPPKRRLYVLPIGLVVCSSGTLKGL